MEGLSNIGVIRGILARHGFTFSKSLGQNFLVNPSVCPRMAELCGAGRGVGVIEIGPGIGVLTHELAQRADKVVCIELDNRLLPVLAETLAEHDNVTVLHADALKVDFAALIAKEFSCMEVVVCANLPYYITSPVIMRLLEERLPVGSITVMVQKEAAQRLCAEPGTRQTGAISIAVQYYSRPEILFAVSRGSFMPAPDVDSCVIRLEVRQTPPVDVPGTDLFFAVVRAAFSQRRKTLLNCLSHGLSRPKDDIARVLERAGVSPGARAETLSLEAFAAIARSLS